MVEDSFKGAEFSPWIQERFDVIALNTRGDREVALDAETSLGEKALAEKLNVTYTPTVIFLNPDNEIVARVNGYRNVTEFKQVLAYVDAKGYESETLAQYLERQKTAAAGAYSFRQQPNIREATDVDDLTGMEGALLLLFEDSACLDCDALHDGHFAAPEVAEALAPFTVVRVDALSDVEFAGIDGAPTTGRKLARALGVDYRPTLVMLSGPPGELAEIARIESMLYRFHFIGLLEYVGLGKYREFPDDPFDYVNDKTAKLLAAGQDVSISDE
jgi:thioredoxin-related protein